MTILRVKEARVGPRGSTCHRCLRQSSGFVMAITAAPVKQDAPISPPGMDRRPLGGLPTALAHRSLSRRRDHSKSCERKIFGHVAMLCAVSDHLVRVFGASPLVAEHVAQVASSYPERGVSARLAQLRFGVDKSILSPAEASELVAEQPEFLECAFSSVYEDEHIVATNKPWDALLSSDAKGPRWDGELSLRDWLKQEHPDTMTEDGEEVRLCHNLDFATSGVIVAAKSRLAADAVSRAFRDREARKLYVALVLGHPTWDTCATRHFHLARKGTKGIWTDFSLAGHRIT